MTEKKVPQHDETPAHDDAPRKDDSQPEQPAPESAEERLDRLQREALRSGTARSAFDQ